MKSRPQHNRKSAALGGLFGAAAVVGSLLLLGGTVSAQGGTAPNDGAPATERIAEATGELELVDATQLDAEFAAFDACLERELGIDFDAIDDTGDHPTDDEWIAAETACEGELPEGVELLTADDIELLVESDVLDQALESGTESLELMDSSAVEIEFAAFDACLERELGIDFDAIDDTGDHPTDDEWIAAETACEGELPEGVELLTADDIELLTDDDLAEWIEAEEGTSALLAES